MRVQHDIPRGVCDGSHGEWPVDCASVLFEGGPCVKAFVIGGSI
jgi:hypothetical protein